MARLAGGAVAMDEPGEPAGLAPPVAAGLLPVFEHAASAMAPAASAARKRLLVSGFIDQLSLDSVPVDAISSAAASRDTASSATSIIRSLPWATTSRWGL